MSAAGVGAGFAEVAQNLGRALFLGALLWALASLVVAAESARGGMPRRTWGWMASFLAAALVAAYCFRRLV